MREKMFRSNAAFSQAVPKYICLAVFLVIVSAALPAYSQSLFASLGLPQSVTPTLANVVNIVVQVAVSYPVMKFWVMPEKKPSSAASFAVVEVQKGERERR